MKNLILRGKRGKQTIEIFENIYKVKEFLKEVTMASYRVELNGKLDNVSDEANIDVLEADMIEMGFDVKRFDKPSLRCVFDGIGEGLDIKIQSFILTDNKVLCINFWFDKSCFTQTIDVNILELDFIELLKAIGYITEDKNGALICSTVTFQDVSEMYDYFEFSDETQKAILRKYILNQY